MTTPYLPTGKTANVTRFEMTCEHCRMPVTSARKDGLHPAYRRHLQAHHPDIYQPVKSQNFRTYPADSVPPAQPDKPARFILPCPYCEFVASALREYQLAGMLTRHKRNEHHNLFVEEIDTRKQESLDALEAQPLISVRVAACYYRNRSMSVTYPEPTTVLVPERWHVTSVFVTCQANGAFVAYRGAVGRSETWGVG